MRRTPHGALIAALVSGKGDDPAGAVLQLVRRDAGDAQAADTLVHQLVEAATERRVESVELVGVLRHLNAPVARRTLAVYLILAEMVRGRIAHSPSLWHEAIARRVHASVASVERSIRALVASGVLKKWQAPRAKSGVSRNADGHAYSHYLLFVVPRSFVRAIREFWEKRLAPAPRPESVPVLPRHEGARAVAEATESPTTARAGPSEEPADRARRVAAALAEVDTLAARGFALPV